MKKRALALALMAALLGLTGCGKQEEDIWDPYDIQGEDPYGIRNQGGFNVFYSVKEAHVITEDGWVFQFIYNYNKTGDQSDIIPYMFKAFNLRCRYDEDYIQIGAQELPNGVVRRYREIPAQLYWGMGSEARGRDMRKVKEILSRDREPEDLLALDPADYEFEELDGEMFFGLIREALTGDFLKEGTDKLMWDKSPNQMMAEPNFIDGYKFQVSYLCSAGNLRELFIDVLYATGPGYGDYVQLSDLVEEGTATPEQVELYKFIQAIIQRAKAENCFSAGAQEYMAVTMDGVDFSRLTAFMNAVQYNIGYEKYYCDSVIEDLP